VRFFSRAAAAAAFSRSFASYAALAARIGAILALSAASFFSFASLRCSLASRSLAATPLLSLPAFVRSSKCFCPCLRIEAASKSAQ
jgi:hypothetical protein